MLEALTTKGTVLSTVATADGIRTVLRVPADVLGTNFFDSAHGKTADLTVDVDGAGRIRQLGFDEPLDGVGTAHGTVAYEDFGVEVDVQRPPADQIEEEQASRVSGGTVLTTPLQDGDISSLSPAQRQQACAGLRSALKSRHAARTEQEKQAARQLDEVFARICAGS